MEEGVNWKGGFSGNIVAYWTWDRKLNGREKKRAS